MKINNENKVTICTAPQGLYAVIKNINEPPNLDLNNTLQIVTAFKYTHNTDNTKIFSEPLVYCDSKEINALIDGQTKIEFIGSIENCTLKINEMISDYYKQRYTKKNETEKNNQKVEYTTMETLAMENAKAL